MNQSLPIQTIQNINLLNTNDPFGRILQSPYGFSFWSWQGNQRDFKSSNWLFWLIVALALCLIIAYYYFCLVQARRRAPSQLNHCDLKVYHQIIIRPIDQAVGSVLLTLSCFRIVLLATGNYPNHWELIPLHFCRLMIVILAISLVFKSELILKNILIFTILGACFGIIFADFNNSSYWQNKGGIAIGYDNYFFWDFLIIHISALLVPSYLLTKYTIYFSKRTILISTAILCLATIVIFGLNWILNTFNDDPHWMSNWFYLAPDATNSVYQTLSGLIGPLARWPLLLFVFIVIGYVLTTINYLCYFYLKKWLVDWKQIQPWTYFWQSKLINKRT